MSTKLTQEDVDQIRALVQERDEYGKPIYTRKQLAAYFGVTYTQIWLIIHRWCWQDIPEDYITLASLYNLYPDIPKMYIRDTARLVPHTAIDGTLTKYYSLPEFVQLYEEHIDPLYTVGIHYEEILQMLHISRQRFCHLIREGRLPLQKVSWGRYKITDEALWSDIVLRQQQRQRKLYYWFLSPNSAVIGPITNISEFCRQYKISHYGVKRLISGEITNFQGWRIEAMTLEDCYTPLITNEE